jgi:hypothetical protein
VTGKAGLLDPVLTGLLGPADEETAAAITGVCGDALHAVLPETFARAVLADPVLLARAAPWALDLARGLQYQDRAGPGDPPTTELLTRLTRAPLSDDQARGFAETVDLAVVLTLGRLTEQVLGPGAGARNPVANQAAAPWLAALKLGYRVGLVLELLRLTAPG